MAVGAEGLDDFFKLRLKLGVVLVPAGEAGGHSADQRLLLPILPVRLEHLAVEIQGDEGEDDATATQSLLTKSAGLGTKEGKPGGVMDRPFDSLSASSRFSSGSFMGSSGECAEECNGLGTLGESRLNLRAGVESNLNFKSLPLLAIFAQSIRLSFLD